MVGQMYVKYGKHISLHFGTCISLFLHIVSTKFPQWFLLFEPMPHFDTNVIQWQTLAIRVLCKLWFAWKAVMAAFTVDSTSISSMSTSL